MRLLSKPVRLLALMVLFGACPTSGSANTETSKLLQELDVATSEDKARALVEPHLENLKALDPLVVEKVVLRQWWDLARDIVSRSHTQQVDLSFPIRRAVRTLKEEADELLRTLNPKYGLAQQVSPAFQWAQNDTSIFLTIKYTVRWNAPGALEVTEPAVTMVDNIFNFTGLGKHSNNKYRYTLSLTLFDNINPQVSSWNAASVGKLTVTLRKNWARKWPRLLANKKSKISNMHVWMEMQEKLDSSLAGMHTVANSPITCSANEKLYCVATDSCKKPENCTQCPGKPTPKPELSLCAGMPSESATLTFTDGDMDENEISGDVRVHKAKNDFDIDAYVLYFGKDERNKLEVGGTPVRLGEAIPTGQDVDIKIPAGTKIPEEATHLLIFSRNEYGEYSSPGSLTLKDAILPKGRAAALHFEDEDGEKGQVSGRVTVNRSNDEAQIQHYALHWGKSATRKVSSNSLISELRADGDRAEPLSHWIPRSTRLPDGASHILVFSKNEHGENPSPTSIKVIDNLKPCLDKEGDDCPTQVAISADTDPDPAQLQFKVTVKPAKQPQNITQYRLYWGRHGCEEGGQTGAKNGHLKDFDVNENLEYELLPDTLRPEGSTHILVFASNRFGESDWCASAQFEDLDNQQGEVERKEL